MNSRSTKFLLLVAAALAAFIFFFERHTTDSGPAEKLADKLFPEFQPAAVTRVELVRSNLVFRAERVKDTWTLTSPLAYPAHQLGINSLLDVCAKLRAQTAIPARQAKSLADFGLHPPAASLTIQQGNTRLELRVGARTPVGEQLYVQVTGSDQIAVVDARLLDLLPRTSGDWRDRGLLTLAGVPYDRLRVRFGARDLVVQRETNHLWRITTPPPAKRADTPQLDQLIAQMQRWPVHHFVTDDPKAELEPFGLQPPEAELAFGSGTNDLLTVQFGKSPTNDAALVYARRSTHTNVVLVPRTWLEKFRVPYWDLCEHRLLDPLPATSFDQIELRGRETLTLGRQASGLWRILSPTNEPADMEVVHHLLAGLAEIEAVELAKEVVTDFVSYGLEPPRRRFSLLQSTTNAAGTPTNVVVAQLDFGANRVDANDQTFFARRHDERFVYAVPRGRPDQLPQSLFQFRERRLWNFTTNDVASVTISQGGLTRKLARNPMRLWAAPGEPTDDVKSAAIDETLTRLGQLRVEAWTAKGAGLREAYGFTNQCRQVVIELATPGKPQTLTLEFGRQPAGRNPYASIADPLDGQPVLFEFPFKLHRELVVPYLNIPALGGL